MGWTTIQAVAQTGIKRSGKPAKNPTPNGLPTGSLNPSKADWVGSMIWEGTTFGEKR